MKFRLVQEKGENEAAIKMLVDLREALKIQQMTELAADADNLIAFLGTVILVADGALDETTALAATPAIAEGV